MDASSLSEGQRIRTAKPVIDDRPRAAILSQGSWQASVGVLLAILTCAGLFAALGRRGYDDPFITFRYAHNLLSGQGFVYNAGQRVLSTTAPLYGFLLAGLGLIWKDLPTVGNVVSLVSLVLGAVFVGALAWKQGSRVPGLIAALLLSLSPDLQRTLGSESCLVVMLILGGLLTYSRSRHALTAILLATAALVRPDAVLASAAIVVFHVARREPIPWRAVLIWTGMVGLWYGALWLYYGSPLPVTLRAKQMQGQMEISERFATGLVSLVRIRLRQPIYWSHGLLGLVGLGRVLAKDRLWIPMLLWTGLYVVAYSLLGVSRYFWYYAPLAPAFAVLVAEGCAAFLALASARLPDRWIRGIVGLLVIVAMAPLVKSTLGAAWNTDPRLEVYQEIGLWLREHTEPETTVGALEVGIMGYYGERRMIDFAGLIQPDVARQLARNGTYQDSAAWAIQQYQPDYVVLQSGGFSDLHNSDWFQDSYQPVRRFSDQPDLLMSLYFRSTER